MKPSPSSSGNQSPAGSAAHLRWMVVCAHCDRVLQTSGWQDSKPGKYDEASLTHDVCPDCIRMLYPRYASVADQLQQKATPQTVDTNKKAQSP